MAEKVQRCPGALLTTQAKPGRSSPDGRWPLSHSVLLFCLFHPIQTVGLACSVGNFQAFPGTFLTWTNPEKPAFGAATGHQADAVIWIGLANAARGSSEAGLNGPPDRILRA